MVAAAKMRRAVEAVLKTRSYANLSWTTILNLINDVDYSRLHPLLVTKKEINNVAIILFAANRGLCGSFSSSLINKVLASVDKHQLNQQGGKINHEFLVIGKKGLALSSRYGYKVVAEFNKNETTSEINDIFSNLLRKSFFAIFF